MRIILYTGKGGVGKTSISAATALLAAELGKRTVVISTDAAHSLADALGRNIGPEPVEIAPHLSAEEINVYHQLKRYWGKIQEYAKKFLAAQGYDEILAEELAVLPGMEDLFSLLRLLDYHQQGDCDLAVVDCAPTGSTLQLLSFTDVMEWYMTRFFNLERKIMRTIKPVAEKLIKAPLPTDDVYSSVESIYEKVMEVKRLLIDPARCSIRLVTNPERMVVKETQRAYTALALCGFPIDLVIANRIMPPEATSGYFSAWSEAQSRNMKELEAAFAPLPILRCPWQSIEPVGLDQLRAMGRQIFGKDDPTKVYFLESPFVVETQNGAATLKLKLPGVSKDRVDLWTKEGELIFRVDDRVRNIILPRALADMRVTKARMEGEWFVVSFAKGLAASAAER